MNRRPYAKRARKSLSFALLVATLMLVLAAPLAAQETIPFTLTSSAFGDGQKIPSRYTCNGTDTSPPLAWVGIPAGTVSLALVADDPDAPGKTWVHWVLYNIDPKMGSIPEGALAEAIGAVSGKNDFKSLGYRGPCPPTGSGNHRYVFTLYALSASPNLEEGATKRELLKAIEGITVGQTKLISLYSR